jgi:hypothetical protein
MRGVTVISSRAALSGFEPSPDGLLTSCISMKMKIKEAYEDTWIQHGNNMETGY